MQDSKNYSADIFVKELQFFSEISALIKQAEFYGDPSAKAIALTHIPLDKIRADAKETFESGESTRNTQKDEEIMGLLRWFKAFFTWVDSPKCHYCASDTSRAGMLEATAEEQSFGASRVEGFTCNRCNAIVRFPRYNNPVKLLETRRGRCGEWANCFTLCACAYGFDARIAFDKTDHVWTEIYSEAEKRYLHCDPCETLCDKPLVYEEGWGKKLSYIIAYSPYQIADVTWRYSRKHREILRNRNLCRETRLLEFILEHNKSKLSNSSRRDEFVEKFVREQAELLVPKSETSAEELQGRISGDFAWRKARLELGQNTPPKSSPSGNVIAVDKNTEEFHLQYSSALNQYLLNGKVVKGWKRLAFSHENIARKEEFDWKTVYLAREENNNASNGVISWKISVPEGLKPRRIYAKVAHATYENGEVDIILCAGDQCIKAPKGAEELSLDALEEVVKEIELKVTLKGGKGNLAWQHSQLFRTSFDSSDYGFEILVTFH